MVEFLTPLGWLVAGAALLPIGAAFVRSHREARVRARIGLAAPGRAAQATTAAAAAIALALLAAATARPAIRTTGTNEVRTDAQIFFVVDVSRSMLARLPHGRTRFARALAAAERLRAGLGDVPAGIASLSDRPLPHLFPSRDRKLFSAVLHRSIGIQRPSSETGRSVYGVATNFDPLAQLASARYFPHRLRHKVTILLTDGESTAFSAEKVARDLRSERVGLLVLRLWNLRERVYAGRGRVEPYRPDRRSLGPLHTLAAAAGGQIYAETELDKLVGAVRHRLGNGPTRTVGRPDRVELSPYLALAAVLPVAFLLRRRDP